MALLLYQIHAGADPHLSTQKYYRKATPLMSANFYLSFAKSMSYLSLNPKPQLCSLYPHSIFCHYDSSPHSQTFHGLRGQKSVCPRQSNHTLKSLESENIQQLCSYSPYSTCLLFYLILKLILKMRFVAGHGQTHLRDQLQLKVKLQTNKYCYQHML